MYKKFYRPILFKQDPESIHLRLEKTLKFFGDYLPFVFSFLNYQVKNEMLRQKLHDVTFNNPVGLAAGFDKNANMIKALSALGFGFLELGTITPLPQAGNPKPRIFRHVKEESLQNSMGFNNLGLEYVQNRLEKIYPYKIPLGLSLGKNKNSQDSVKDYLTLANNFKDLCDYYVINISSPNTANLRDLQNEEFLTNLCEEIRLISTKAIFIKLAADLEVKQAINLCIKAVDLGFQGIILNNTSTNYSLVENPQQTGGISGRAITKLSNDFFSKVAKEIYKHCTLIAVGGIFDANEAYDRIKKGASLVQIYTSMIYEGAGIAKKINKDLIKLIKADGFKNITEACGSYYK